jgi:hypothetical protein
MPSTTLRSASVSALVASALGAVALFLPFTSGVSPWRGLWDFDKIWMVAVPFFVALPLLYLSGRLLLVGGVGLSTRRLAGVLSVAVILVTVAFYVVPGDGPSWSSWRERMTWVVPIALIILEAGLLWRLRRRGQVDALALSTLIGAYLPNAALCLIAFGGDWQVGAWFVAARTEPSPPV